MIRPQTAKASILRERFYLYLVGNLRSDLVAAQPYIRMIKNPFEQFLLFPIGISGLSLYAPASDATVIPILTAMFLIGRMFFWFGYHKNTHLRAYGFGLTFYPTVVVYAWLVVRMTTGYAIPI